MIFDMFKSILKAFSHHIELYHINSFSILTLLLIKPRLTSLLHMKHNIRLKMGLATYWTLSVDIKSAWSELFLKASVPNSIYSWQMLASTAA